MSIFPVTPLVGKVQRLVVETFDVSEREAEEYAAELVALAEGWGEPGQAGGIDWDYRIRKRLGGDLKLKWRSEEERNIFAEAQRLNSAAYEAMIPRRPERA
ncbi:MAG: hypothetical protein ACAI34_13100 [Verrucomicrobium sp.]|nr:hypothetical protein [Verrucomicrobium sp.]